MLTIVLTFVYWIVVLLLVRFWIKSFVTSLIFKERKVADKKLSDAITFAVAAQADATVYYVNEKIDLAKKQVKQSVKDKFIDGLDAANDSLDEVRHNYRVLLDATINGLQDLNGRVNDLVDYNGVEYKTTPAKPAEKKLVKKAAKK